MDRKKIDAYFDRPEARAELIAAVSRLVAVKSVKGESAPGAPFGPGPKAALEEALALCSELGLRAENYADHVGTVDLNDKDTQLHILGHLDVVPEGSGWETDPYTCVEQDGMLYGRGVSDDKGPVCAAILAMKAVRDLGGAEKNVRLILGTDEESGSADIAYYYAHEPYAPYSFTPDADFPLINIEKGHYHPSFGKSWSADAARPQVTAMKGGFRFNVVPPEAEATVTGLAMDPALESLCRQAEKVTGAKFQVEPCADGVRFLCHGRNAHAATPEEGVNSIQALLEVLCRLPLAECESTKAIGAMHTLFPFGDTRGKGLGIAQSDTESGELTLNLALIDLDETGFSAKFDTRFPLCANEDNCKKVCEASLDEHGIAVTEDADMTTVHCVPAESEFVQTLLKCYAMYTGEREPKPLAIGGGTYVHNIPGGVAFGCEFPGFDSKMHAAGEQIKVDNLLLSAKIFTQAIFELCGEATL